jgi:hypothetical protein
MNKNKSNKKRRQATALLTLVSPSTLVRRRRQSPMNKNKSNKKRRQATALLTLITSIHPSPTSSPVSSNSHSHSHWQRHQATATGSFITRGSFDQFR